MRLSIWLSKVPLWIRLQPDFVGVLVATAGGVFVRVDVAVAETVLVGVGVSVLVRLAVGVRVSVAGTDWV
jgi:hypothetical protein